MIIVIRLASRHVAGFVTVAVFLVSQCLQPCNILYSSPLSSWGASSGLAKLVPMNRRSPTVIIEEEFIGVVVILQLEMENLRNVIASDGLQGDSFL